MTAQGEVFRAKGSPRSQGRAEGLAQHKDFVSRGKSHLSWWLRSLRISPHCLGLAQQVPQAYERLAGFSAATRIPVAELFEMDLAAVHPSGWGIDAQGLWLSHSASGRVRELRSDAGFATLEWLDPGRFSPSLGCNEAGLAGLAATTAPRTRDRAPSHWLLGEALLRFEAAEVAADWCARRQPDGDGYLVFCDRDGDVFATEIEGNRAQVRSHRQRSSASTRFISADGRGLTLAAGTNRQRFEIG